VWFLPFWRGPSTLDFSTLDSEDGSAAPASPYRWPLTDLPAPDGRVITRRPISLKIDNFHDARPQTNLTQADIVYETEVEGGMTRFHAIFHSTLPDMAGPIRSARLTDAWVVPQWDSYLIYSGSTEEVHWVLSENGVELMTETADGRMWERVDWRIAPHNLYVHADGVADVAAESGIQVTGWAPRSLEYGALTEEDTGQGTPEDVGGVLAPAYTTINVPFAGVAVVWRWDEASQSYLRSEDGEPHCDAVSGLQISARNVVVLWADYDNLGTGLVALFRDGRRLDGNWSTAPGQPPLLRTIGGTPLTFQSGNTWFEVVPDGTPVVVE